MRMRTQRADSGRGPRTPLLLLATSLLCLPTYGCAARYSYAQLDDDWYEGRLERGGILPPMEFALMSANRNLGPGAVALSLEFLTQPIDPAVVPPVKDWESINMWSLMVGARYYPWSVGPLLPYAGGGFGRTSLGARWTEYIGGGFDPIFRCIGICDNTEERRGSLVANFHPYLAGGLEVRPAFMRPSILVEYRRDFSRGDDFYQLDGQSVSLGLRWYR